MSAVSDTSGKIPSPLTGYRSEVGVNALHLIELKNYSMMKIHSSAYTSLIKVTRAGVLTHRKWNLLIKRRIPG
jgi:hypothetical protein